MNANLLLLTVVGLASHAFAWDIKDYNPVANPNATVNVTNARFTVLTPNLIRMEYDPSNKFEDRASLSIVNRYFGKVPSFTQTVSNGNLTIKTDDLTLVYKIGEQFASNTLLITGNVDGFSFSYTTTGNTDTDNSMGGNLFGTIRSLDEIDGSISLNCTQNADVMIHDESLHCTWSLFGRGGYALLNDTNSTFMDGNWLSEDWANQNKQDWYFFGHGMNYQQAIYDFVSISGSVPLVPRYALGSMHCRWYDYSDLQIKQAIEAMQDRYFPVDAAVIDMDWHIFGPWGAYSYNTHLLPNFNLTQSWLHRKGIRTAANIHDDNGIAPTEHYYAAAAAALGVSADSQETILFNVTDYDYMMVLEDIVMLPISEPANASLFDSSSLQHGWDFWWIDWQQGGTQGIYYSSTNPTIMLNYVRSTDHLRRDENVRGFVIGRYGGYGNQRYPGAFSGDVKHDWKTLQFEPYYTHTGSNVAYNYISHDIMGAAGDDELNTRWIQFGAYSPIFRTHDAGGAAGTCADNSDGCPLVDIWTHPWKNFDIERHALQERSELLPYLYNASYTAYLTGLGLTLPLYILYPTQDESYNYPNQYIFGNSVESGNIIMIYPITNASGNCNNPMGGCFNLTEASIWIPDGTSWYEEHSGKYVNGTSSDGTGNVISRWFDLSEYPIYVMSGAIIVKQPFDKRVVTGRANLKYYDQIRFDIYPDFGSNDGSDDFSGTAWIYEDDGISMDYMQSGGSVKTTFEYVFSVSTGLFVGTISSEGGYPDFPETRTYSVGIKNVLPPVDGTVTCAGETLAYNFLWYGTELEHSSGWYFDSTKMTLFINCPESSTSETLSIEATFNENWATGGKMLNGLKGKINRAVLSKGALDEANVEYGPTRQNLTDAAAYSTLLGDVGYDSDRVMSLVDAFEALYEGGMSQIISNVNPPYACSNNRKQYSINLLSTM